MKKTCVVLSLMLGSAAVARADWGYFAADRSWVSFAINGANTPYSLWNGTGDWYDPGASPAVVNNGTYDGANLGTFNTGLGHSLVLTSFDFKTWKNDVNGWGDIQNASLRYAITLQGVNPVTFNTLNGGWLQELGGYNQLWGAQNQSLNILQGLPGGNYELHLYGIINDLVDGNWWSSQNLNANWQGLPGDGLADNNGTMLDRYTAGFTVVTPIPEPATLGLMGLGAACILARRRRQR